MKNTILIILFAGCFSFALSGQYTQSVYTQSSGASFSQNGTYESRVVVGQAASNGGINSPNGYSGSIGFLTRNTSSVNLPPIADSGENTSGTNPYIEGESVVLDASQSYDPEGAILNYHWVSLDGITLSDTTIVNPLLIAPDVNARRKFRFTLTVDDGDLFSNTDTVMIIVSDPSWIPVVYTNSSTMYGLVALNGIAAESGDQVAAFVDNECRGFSEVFDFQGQAYAVLNISSVIQEPATFMVYDYSNDIICNDDNTITTEPGGDLGSPSNPIPIIGACGIVPNSYLTVSSVNFNVTSASGCLDVSVSSNISWTTSSQTNWVTGISPDSGEDDSIITICYEENTETTSRIASIDVAGSGLTETITINQNGNNPDALTFKINEACGTTGETIQIPVTVEQFNNISGFQKSIRIVNSDIAEFESVEETGINGIVSNTSSDVISMVWFSQTGGITLSDDTEIYLINVKVLGNSGESTMIQFDDVPTSILAYSFENNQFEEVPVNPINGIVSACSNFDVSGDVYNEAFDPLNGVALDLTGFSSELFTTNTSGFYQFPELQAGENYSIIPSKNTGVTNGVNVLDILHIQKHILNIELLNSPYKMIAADVDKSGTITVLDIIFTQQLIITEITAFPNNESWRFIPADYQFTSPQNPFLDNFPESLVLNDLNSDQIDEDFIAVKVGDVDVSSNTALLIGGNGADSRNATDHLAFGITKKEMDNSIISVGFQGLNFKDIAGFQFTLSFDNEELDFLEVETTSLDNLSENNFYLNNADNGLITLCWHMESGKSSTLSEDLELFSLKFRTRKGDIDWPTAFSLNSAVTPAQAFKENKDLLDIASHFLSTEESSVPTTEAKLFQNRPNPFKKNTLIPFYLPESSQVKLSIFNSLGEVVKVHENEYDKGYHEVLFQEESDISGSILYYRLETPRFQAVLPMLKID